MLSIQETLFAKIETTYNTDPTPVASANAILASNVSWAKESTQIIDRSPIKPTFGSIPHVYGGGLETITFDVECKGSGTAGTAPELGVLLRGCAYAETIVASTSVTYKPASESLESLTIYYNQDGKLRKLTGARGNVSGDFQSGQAGVFSFTMTGHSAVVDAALGAPTFNAQVAIPFNGATLVIGAYTPIIQSFTFDKGNALAMAPDMNSADSFGEVRVTNHEFTGTLNPEDQLVATYDFDGIFKAATSFIFNTGVIGGTAGNRVSFSHPVARYRDLSPGDRDGNRTQEVSIGMYESSSLNDAQSIAFT